MSSSPLSPPALARLIDHTLLKAEATAVQIQQLCTEARAYRFAAVCINPLFVPLAAAELSGTDVAICTVVGFPLGATTTAVKVYETEQAIQAGASEIDMVISIGRLKAGDTTAVHADIAAVVQAAHAGNALVKVIIETALLTNAEKQVACQLAQAAGADFVKTSTGFGPGGATSADIALMRQTIGPDMGLKAAGGIRTWADAQAMIAAGATRLGASASIHIISEASQP